MCGDRLMRYGYPMKNRLTTLCLLALVVVTSGCMTSQYRHQRLEQQLAARQAHLESIKDTASSDELAEATMRVAEAKARLRQADAVGRSTHDWSEPTWKRAVPWYW